MKALKLFPKYLLKKTYNRKKMFRQVLVHTLQLATGWENHLPKTKMRITSFNNSQRHHLMESIIDLNLLLII